MRPDLPPPLSVRRTSRSAEHLVRLPNAGLPTEEERTWRRNYQKMRTPEIFDAMVKEKTIDQWIHLLTSEDLRWAMRAARYLRYIAALHEERLVRVARELEWGWDDIAYLLGMSRQALHKRWAARLREEQETRERSLKERQTPVNEVD